MLSSNSDEKQQTKKSKKSKKRKKQKWLEWLKKPSTFRFLLQVGLSIYKLIGILSELLGRD